MSFDSQAVLQAALVAALKAEAAVTGLLAEGADSLFDQVPAESAFPYVVIGEMQCRPFGSKSEQGLEVTLTLHAWSRYRGFREVKRIMAALAAALERRDLSLEGQTLVELRFLFSDVRLDPDGLTRHGIQRFRALTQPTA